MNEEKFMQELNWMDAEVQWNNDPASAKDCICIPTEEWNKKIKPIIEAHREIEIHPLTMARIWWNSNFGNEPFWHTVKSVEEASEKLNLLTAYDLYQGDKIDANTGGLEVYNKESKEFEEWYCEESGIDIMETIQTEQQNKPRCGRCGSTNLDINGIFYTCNNCWNIDDSDYNMIMHNTKKEE